MKPSNLVSVACPAFEGYSYEFRHLGETLVIASASRGNERDTMSKRSCDPQDMEVGRRIRVRRLTRNMSQTDLATQLGLTFQQVQKYEKGTNRVGAGRLKRIAEILEAPITYFYSVSDQPASRTVDILGFVDNARTLRLVRAYSRIEDPQLQLALLEVTERIAGEAVNAE
jgi:transcriptional regulator with XRE-family HTH domain